MINSAYDEEDKKHIGKIRHLRKRSTWKQLNLRPDQPEKNKELRKLWTEEKRWCSSWLALVCYPKRIKGQRSFHLPGKTMSIVA